jgi:hypothetical protein
MFASQRFAGNLARLRKAHRTSPPEEQLERVRAAFTDAVGSLPNGMADEILDHFLSRIAPDAVDGEQTIFDQCEPLSEVLDVLAGQYDEETDPLTRPDWAALAEITSDFAHELDMELVNYIMKRAVDHNAL